MATPVPAEGPFITLWNPFTIIALTISLTVWFIISMPFIGVLVRYRANYVPKRVRLDTEDGTANETGSDSNLGYFGMMKRVYRIEGWAGLYKGMMPSIIHNLIATVTTVPVLLAFRFILPQPSVVYPMGLAISLIPVVLLIPMLIITNRAITTPHKLAFFEPKVALRVLLSQAEREKPLHLYLAPGVALCAVLLAFVPIAVSILRRLFSFHTYPGHPHYYPPHLCRRGEPAIVDRVVESVAADTVPVYSTEDVMEFRTQQAPYTSLVDCWRTVVREEGRGALFRAWWVTALFVVLPVLFVGQVPPGAPGPRSIGF
ncbi:mitochondrial carrier [Mycena rebaudengoi]|nr:mitochondrial carrier [Mycena rebaudengoi]